MIKPEFFSSESLSECSFAARLCFIGLWTCADDSGHLKFSPKSLRKEIFGLDEVTMEEFVGYMAELEAVGCIRLYAAGGSVFVDIPNFGTYQTISHPSKTNIPEPSMSAPVVLHECSMSAPPNELINELINQGTRGGHADAPPAPSDWRSASPMYSDAE